MDVFLRDENKIINVEVQTRHKKEVSKGSRYYQSVADIFRTPSGSKYHNLPDNIIILPALLPLSTGCIHATLLQLCSESYHHIKVNDSSCRIF